VTISPEKLFYEEKKEHCAIFIRAQFMVRVGAKLRC